MSMLKVVLMLLMAKWMSAVAGDEDVVADRGHRGHPLHFDAPWDVLDSVDARVRKALARARHECINRRFKCWNCLKEEWRHALELHGVAFSAVANIEQFLLMHRPTWQVQYNDRINNFVDL